MAYGVPCSSRVPSRRQGDIGMEGPRGGVGLPGETVSIDCVHLIDASLKLPTGGLRSV